MLSSVSISRYASSSRARSSSQRLRNRKRLTDIFCFLAGPRPRSRCLAWPQALCRPQNPIHRADDGVPAVGLFSQLLASRRRQAVVTRLPVVLGGTPEGRNPPTVLEPVQGGIE